MSKKIGIGYSFKVVEDKKELEKKIAKLEKANKELTENNAKLEKANKKLKGE